MLFLIAKIQTAGLLQCPLGAILCILYLDAYGFEVITDAVAGSPVLGCLGSFALFKYHLHQSVNRLGRFSTFALLVTKSENSGYYIVKQVCEGLIIRFVKSEFLVLDSVDYTHCVKYVRESYRSVEVVAQSLICVLDDGLYLRI